MKKTILLVGRTLSVVDDVMARVQMPGLQLLKGNTIDDLSEAFAAHSIDHVILGGGIDLDQRLEIVRKIFQLSSATTVHMNSPSGPESFLPFVQAVLNGIKNL